MKDAEAGAGGLVLMARHHVPNGHYLARDVVTWVLT